MRVFVEHSNRFLDTPLDLGPRGVIVAAALILIPTFLFPLWSMTMFAPQYPDGLRLYIKSYGLDAGNEGQDLKEVNILNHYIGMKDLSSADFTEFKWMPFVIGGIGLLLLRAAVMGRMQHLLDVLVLFGYFAAFSLWSFGYKMWSYGHNLAPSAPVKVDPFMPPLFGGKQLANFEVYSYPAVGTYALVAAPLLLIVAVCWAWRQGRSAARPS